MLYQTHREVVVRFLVDEPGQRAQLLYLLRYEYRMILYKVWQIATKLIFGYLVKCGEGVLDVLSNAEANALHADGAVTIRLFWSPVMAHELLHYLHRVVLVLTRGLEH